MGLESSVNGIDDFNTAWPLNTEVLSEADDHLRLIKAGTTGTFAELASSGGVVNADATELNYLQGVTANVQTELDALTSEPVWTRPTVISISSRRLFYTIKNTKNLLFSTGDGGTIEVYLPTTVGAIQGDFVEFTLANPVTNTGARPGSFRVYRGTHVGDTTNFLARFGGTGTWSETTIKTFDVVNTNPVVRCAFDAVEAKWRVWRVDYWQ